ncbi:MAG: RNA methyltransferase, partial [Oscillospiraceae bacterium]|nr:RNA methyltransferase [Oscillospiraceae bacterium]
MQKLTEITSRDNPAVKHYIRLRDKKKARQEENLFVAEGFRIVRDALRKPYAVQQIFLTDSAFERFAKDLTCKEECPVFRISDAIGKWMSDTEHTQGVFAVCRKPMRKLKLQPSEKYLVLCQLQDPGNIGMILRTCDALGTNMLLLTECCDIYSPKVVRATMGAVFRVPFLEIPSWENLFRQLEEAEITSYASVPAEDAVSLTEKKIPAGSAVWIGNEGNGLPKEMLSLCQKKITIPMKGEAESLNAAMAAGIFLWEMMD